MCGILAVLGCAAGDEKEKRARVLELSRRLKHRGPDWSGLRQVGDCYLSHQRLAIVDPASGDQPLYNEDQTVVVTVNGEIYNHQAIREQLAATNHKFRTGSDCEVIAHLYEEHGEEFVDMLDGVFAFVLLDTRSGTFLAARDAIGVTPLYIGKNGGGFRRWYNPPWFSEEIPSVPYDPLALRKAFEKAVTKRLMTDVPFGVLLSGGLDSSLVAAVTGSPDLKAAKEVADYLGTVHTEFYFTVQDGIDAIEDVIYHTETYDVTTIRASTPMFLMSRKIKALGVKMVISGEGSDEIFGGYLYFHKAPNKEEFHRETCRKLKALHQYDCLRANKATSAWGLEARVPFLDKEFINEAMSIDPEWKMIRPDLGRIEKWAVRKAFDDEEQPYLPKKSAILTVPGGPSVACSTAKAIEWDAQWSGNLDPSGRAALGVHVAAYEEESEKQVKATIAAGASTKKPRTTIEVVANGVAIEG
ncbi:hypothetical protein PR202_ga25023 [Eleusine coracana subsp. coracana]|uniref:Asparagine synthetase [glutamine-hydrolyzing] n=1 Tax=Eleusine coracana subsp. coracana TaxID=191504 RepID=A0AAV5DA38_ELECO|nr:hypothetical protein PR202_ga25023 [Eleusine coracana subsp. coracana]